ncbi:MAG: hypothetical protein LBU74_06265 [Methanobacteriaceae archaeon]|nr:hypothetical protein [Candidatus Methanorudis spinitermitis]
MDFPGDIGNYSNIGNVINCQCGVEYGTQEELEEKNNKEEIIEKTEVYQENMEVDGQTEEYNVHDFNEGELKIYEPINANDSLVDEVKSHYDSLPENMKNSVNEIVITNQGNSLGWVDPQEIDNGMKRLYVNPNNCLLAPGKTYQDTINHEIGHLMDRDSSGSWTISNGSYFKDGFVKDQQIMLGKELRGVEPYLEKNTFASGYAYSRYSMFPDRPYSEEFAEGVMKYMNKDTHDIFVSNFPHKAEVLRNIIYL